MPLLYDLEALIGGDVGEEAFEATVAGADMGAPGVVLLSATIDPESEDEDAVSGGVTGGITVAVAVAVAVTEIVVGAYVVMVAVAVAVAVTLSVPVAVAFADTLIDIGVGEGEGWGMGIGWIGRTWCGIWRIRIGTRFGGRIRGRIWRRCRTEIDGGSLVLAKE